MVAFRWFRLAAALSVVIFASALTGDPSSIVAQNASPPPDDRPTQLSLSFDSMLDPGSIPGPPATAIPYRFRASALPGGPLDPDMIALPPGSMGWSREPEAIIVFMSPSTPSGTYTVGINLAGGQHAEATFEHLATAPSPSLANVSGTDNPAAGPTASPRAPMLPAATFLQQIAPPLQVLFPGIVSSNRRGPPDLTLAAGPLHLLLATNQEISLRDKTGTVLATSTLVDVFRPVESTGERDFTDPRAYFDPISNRFFLVGSGAKLQASPDQYSCEPGQCIAHIFLAVSKNDRPATLGPQDWYLYALPRTTDRSSTTPSYSDFDNLGIDDHLVVISSNGPGGAPVRVFDKEPLLRGSMPDRWTIVSPFTDPLGGNVGATIPSMPARRAPGTTGPILLVTPARGCGFTVWSVQGSPDASEVTSHAVPDASGCAPKVDSPQSGGPPVDVAPGLSSPPLQRDGQLWIAEVTGHDFGSGVVDAIRLTALDVSRWPDTPTVVQDVFFGEDKIWSAFPGIAVDSHHNVALVYARFTPNDFPSAFYTVQTADDPAGTFRTPHALRVGTAALIQVDPQHNERNRFGDFFDAAIDPVDDTIWIYGQSGERGGWTASVGRINAHDRSP